MSISTTPPHIAPDVSATPGLKPQAGVMRWAWILLMVLPLVGLLLFTTLQPIQVLPRMGLAPGYALRDQDGNQVTNEDLRGKITLYNFTYSGCADGCVQTSGLLKTTQEWLKGVDTQGYDIELVTITIDPEHDSPETLQRFAAAQGAEPEGWRFLTGAPDKVKMVVGGGFGVFYEAQTNGSFQFEPMGARYRTTPPSPEILQRDISLVLTEAQNSTGPTALIYETAHLFLCYPK
jgi:protein SCO1/2